MNSARCLAAIFLGTLALSIGGCDTAGVSGGRTPGAEISTFSKSYGGPLHDDAQVVLNTEDGGFLLLGSADAHTNMNTSKPVGGDFWLQKLDANGNVEVNHTIGLRSPYTPGTTWRAARPTFDGGAVLVGSHGVTQEVQRVGGIPGEAATVAVSSSDIAIARLDAAGNVIWNVTHDSGAWVNYDYFERNGEAAAAWDFGSDVWPMDDGGFLVAGRSYGNLEDRLDIGFPCDDEELDEFLECRPTGGFRFLYANSIVVLRLNADGSLRWLRRLTDGAFTDLRNERIRIRATSDDGALLSRAVRRHGTSNYVSPNTVIHRLQGDGTQLWRRVIRRWGPTVDMMQTDDPVDGPGRDRHDGVRDDGFVLTDGDRVLRFDARGVLQWNRQIDLERDALSSADVNALSQRCEYGEITRCDIVIAGGTQILNLNGFTAPAGYVAFLDEEGDIRVEVYADPVGISGGNGALLRIADGGSGRFRLLSSEGSLIDLVGPPSEPVFVNERRGEGFGSSHAELLPNGGVLAFIEGVTVWDEEDERYVVGSRQRLRYFDDQARQRLEVPLDQANQFDRLDGETLQAAVQIAPGSFVLAGTRTSAEGQSGIVVLRYDLNASGGRIVWQRRFARDEQARLLAAAPSGDGGVILSLFADLDPSREGSQVSAMIIKLDAAGNPQGVAGYSSGYYSLDGLAIALQPMSDGGFAALVYTSEPLADQIFARVGQAEVLRFPPLRDPQRDDRPLWHTPVSLGPLDTHGSVEAMAATADGGLVLAGTFGARISVVLLGPDGALVSARSVVMPSSARLGAPHIRQAPDGGFVLAMTEQGLISRLGTHGRYETNSTNVLVMKLDAVGAPQWAHVYGAGYEEGVTDLAIRADGTIAVAGYSESFGDRREALLLKLSPHGLINEGGCQALLASFQPWMMGGGPIDVIQSPAMVTWGFWQPWSDLVFEFVDAAAPMRTPTDFVTARQCLGDARAGGSRPPTWRLGVVQVGAGAGVVTSTPTGISCGTGLNICAADFPRGTRVALRANIEGFNSWRGTCDEGTGGTSLDCVIQLDRDRTIEVDFGSSTPRLFELSFSVQGGGAIRADGGIDCREGSGSEYCVRQFGAGAVVDAVAEAFNGQVFLGWRGEPADGRCESFGDQPAIQITMDRNLSCIARFGAADERLVALTVFGEGRVRDEPDAAAIDCRAGGTQQDCQEIYTSTAIVTLRAEPDTGRRFEGWGGDCASHGADPVIEILTSQSFLCRASFVPLNTTAALHVQITGGATNARVESSEPGIDCTTVTGSDCSEVYPLDTPVILRATPLAGFRSWQGCDEVVDVNFCHVTMNQTRAVTANFRTSLLTLVVSGAGTVRDVPPLNLACRAGQIGSGCEAGFASYPSETIRLEAMPDSGQRFVSWGGDCASFGSAAAIDLIGTRDMVCTAGFEPEPTSALLTVELIDPAGTANVSSIPPGIACIAGPGGDCSEHYPPGTQVVLRASRPGVIWTSCDQVADVVNCVVNMNSAGRYVRALFP